MMSGPRVFHRNEMVLTEAVTPTGNTSIARVTRFGTELSTGTFHD